MNEKRQRKTFQQFSFIGIKGQQIFRIFSLFGDQLTCEPVYLGSQ